MNENLIGYLLDALDENERHRVEGQLRDDPAAQRRLEQLRASLEPLASDRDAIEPPEGLWVRTLARVAEYRCRTVTLPSLPAAGRMPAAPRNWWRRTDVMVAASILFCIALLIPPGLSYVQYRHNIVACQNNLQNFYTSLKHYSDHHDGAFPNVAVAAPRDVAGVFIPILNEDRLLDNQVSVICPAMGNVQAPLPLSLRQIADLRPEDFEVCARGLAGCYGYSLGYVDELGHHGLRLDMRQGNNAFLPIMADCPPADVDQGNPGNSLNHAGRGQNVLYIDGHTAFCNSRTVGVGRDDIYLNYDNQVAAGKSIWDAVLGNSAAHP
jgi:hypothetical protein